YRWMGEITWTPLKCCFFIKGSQLIIFLWLFYLMRFSLYNAQLQPQFKLTEFTRILKYSLHLAGDEEEVD
ncbi:hypothetical protein ACJX0J_021578, partial [Zea mays]